MTELQIMSSQPCKRRRVGPTPSITSYFNKVLPQPSHHGKCYIVNHVPLIVGFGFVRTHSDQHETHSDIEPEEPFTQKTLENMSKEGKFIYIKTL